MTALQRLVAYERMSTAHQGGRGRGLEAQRSTVEAFAASRGAVVLVRVTKLESGKRAGQPR